MLPILHLNGYKINNPTLLSRIPSEELESLFIGYGWKPHFVEGEDPLEMHNRMASVMEICMQKIIAIQHKARSTVEANRAEWPMIILRSPKRWTCPKEVDGHKVEGFWRAHHVPLSNGQNDPQQL